MDQLSALLRACLLTCLLTCLATASLAAAETTVAAGSALIRLPKAERTTQVAQLWRATAVDLPHGNVTAAQAVAALAVGGNEVHLDERVDAAAVAELGGGSSDFWTAVLVVAEAFALDLAPGIDLPEGAQITATHHIPGSPADLQAGAVTLVPRIGDGGAAPPQRAACGPLLAEVVDLALSQRDDDARRWIDLAVRLRIEPRFGGRAIGGCKTNWQPARSDTGTGVGMEQVDARVGGVGDGLIHLRIPEAPEGLGGFTLAGTATIDVLEALTVEHAMHPGDALHIDLGDHQLTLRLLDAEGARADGKREAGLFALYPTAALANPPVMAASVAGKLLTQRGTSASATGEDREHMQFLGDVTAVEHQVTLLASLPMADIELAVELPIDLLALPRWPLPRPTNDPDPESPTLVDLPAGEPTLQEAVRLLNAGGNTVVLDLGLDIRARAALPGGRMPFWQAALAVCAAFDLDVLAPAPPAATGAQARIRPQRHSGRHEAQGATVHCGSLRLGRRAGERSHSARTCLASGSVLVETVATRVVTTQRLAGIGRQATVSVRLRLEPRIAAEMISDAAISWASGAAAADGQPLVVMPALPASEPDHDPAAVLGQSQVLVDQLPRDLERFRLDGQLLFKLRRRVHAEATLDGEAPVQLALGRTQVSATLMIPVDQERGGVRLVYRSGAFEGLEVALSGADGRLLQQAGRNSRSSHPRSDETWLFTGIDPGKPYTLSLAHSEVLAQPVLPIAAVVELP